MSDLLSIVNRHWGIIVSFTRVILIRLTSRLRRLNSRVSEQEIE